MKKTKSAQIMGIYLITALALSLLNACSGTEAENLKHVQTNKMDSVPTKKLAKFEPTEDRVLVFAGQDLESIGGFEPYNNGYADHFPLPAGITLYTRIGAGENAEDDLSQGLNGLFETVDVGNGPSNIQLITEQEKFKGCALAIGLSMVGDEKEIASGFYDENIKKLGQFLLSLEDRPVFLRVGYEFDGHLWNNYDINAYKKAYRRVKDLLDQQGVKNTAYVWQSTGWVSNMDQLEEWYPGDEYVDWCGYSFFSRFDEAKMIEFARLKHKPVFIAEATPSISDHNAKFTGDTKETILSNPAQAQEAMEKWFKPFFSTIENNLDVVKAIHYINCNWSVRPMWVENPSFKGIDARLQTNEAISKMWMDKMNSGIYINESSQLKKDMGLYQQDETAK